MLKILLKRLEELANANGNPYIDYADIVDVVQEMEKDYNNESIPCSNDVKVMIGKPFKNIIENLEQSRPWSCENSFDRGYREALNKAIKIVQEVADFQELASARWIPVEESLPDYFTHIYATCVSLVDDKEEPWVIESYYTKKGWDEIAPVIRLGKAKVTAWMPKINKVPAPYREYNNGWIPCSSGQMPNDGEDVLVWFEYFRYGDYNRLFQTHGIGFALDGRWSGFVNGSSGWSQLRIIAWQPLPPEYKESDV